MVSFDEDFTSGSVQYFYLVSIRHSIRKMTFADDHLQMTVYRVKTDFKTIEAFIKDVCGYHQNIIDDNIVISWQGSHSGNDEFFCRSEE